MDECTEEEEEEKASSFFKLWSALDADGTKGQSYAPSVKSTRSSEEMGSLSAMLITYGHLD